MRAIGIVSATAILVGSCSALALPREGELVRDARAEDADGRTFSLAAHRGKPTLIVYEDRGASQDNAPFKAELARLAAGGRYKSTVVLAAVADVTHYDFWPARGFVKDAIRKQSIQFGTTIYCDWSGAFRASLGLRQNASNIVLLDRGGRVLFAASGPLDPSARTRLLALLKSQTD